MRWIGRVLTGALLLASTGCTSASEKGQAAAPEGPRHIHATHDHPGEHPDGNSHGKAHGDESHHSEHALATALLSASDLPVGYTAGAGHHGVVGDGPPPNVPAECTAIADLIGTHPAVATPHPHADISFSKSHFGPEISQRIIDYGDPAQAENSLAALSTIAITCPVYEQQGAGPGVDRYRVTQGERVDGASSGQAIHLEAIGDDFKGIHWDIWATESDGQIIAVSLRSARGGTSVDLGPAITAASARL